MSKKASVVLTLKDNFTNPLKRAKEGTKQLDRETKIARKSVRKFADSLDKKLTKALKVTAAAAGGVSIAAFKVGFSEALDLEGYKTQLETATKDTKKASKIMQYSINLANKTPFEGGEVVEAAAKFEAMGMSAKKWLTYAGDMAGATNKSMDQSVEALIDAQAGELERLKEFGITKRMIQDKAEKMFKNEQVINNKGQIENQEKFNEAMLALMKDKFSGGMEKQSKTLRGMWSTVTGVTKNALANVIGMSSDGTVRAGSALDIFKSKIGSVTKMLEKWQSDGTLDRLAQKVGAGLSKALTTAGTAMKWVKDNASWLKPVAIGLFSAFAAYKTINEAYNAFTQIRSAIKICKTAFGGLNLATMGWIGIIVAVIAIIVLVVKNWKTVVAWLKKLKDRFMNAGGAIGVFRDGIFTVVAAFKAVIGTVKKVIGKVKEFLGLNTDKTINVKTVEEGLDAGAKAMQGAPVPKHATGTTYFKGGLTGFSENGRAEEAIFPSGTRIIPADKAGKGTQGKIVNVYLTVQGNVIGNEKYMEETGNYIARKIIAAEGNI